MQSCGGVPRRNTRSAATSWSQRAPQPVLRRRDDRREQFVGELAPDHGADLRHLLGRRRAGPGGPSAIPQGRWNRERRQRAGSSTVAGFREQARLDHRPGQLLDEQRHPSVPATICSSTSPERLAAGDRATMGGLRRPRRLRVRRERCGGRPAASNSGRKVISSRTGSRGSARPTGPISSSEVGSIQCASSNTIRTGSMRSEARQPVHQRASVSLLLPLRASASTAPIAPAGRQRQQCGKSARPRPASAAGSSASSFDELVSDVVVAAKPRARSSRSMTDRARCGVVGEHIAQRRVRPAGERSAAAGRAGTCRRRARRTEHGLAVAVLECGRRWRRSNSSSSSRPTSGVVPPCSASKRPSAVPSPSTAKPGTGSARPLSLSCQGPSRSNSRPGAARALGDRPPPWLGDRLRPRGKVRRFAETPPPAASPIPIRSPTTTGRWRYRPGLAAERATGRSYGDCRGDAKSGAHGPLGVVLCLCG